MTFTPVLPFPILIPLTILVVIGCVILAVTRSRKRLMWISRAVTVLLMALAVARPGLPTEVIVSKQEASAQVYFVVDVTASMIAEDWDRSAPRMDGLKKDLTDLIDAMPAAKFSLITFNSNATVRVPLTTDDAAMRSAISILEPETTRSSGGTSPMEPASLLSERLAEGKKDNPDEAQYVFYFGDGEATARDANSSFDGQFNVSGGAVFGYGTPAGGQMKETLDNFSTRKPEYIMDPSTDQPALSKIDENTLNTIASALGVEYHHRDAGTPITQSFSVPTFESKLVDKRDQRGVNEIYWVPLIAVFVMLVVEMTLSVKRVREIARIGKS